MKPLAYLESLIDSYGLYKVITYPFSATAVLVGIGVFSGGTMVALSAFALGSLSMLIVATALGLRNRNLRRALGRAQEDGATYARRLVAHVGLSYDIVSWEEEQKLGPKGMSLTRRVTIRANGAAMPLEMIRCTQEPPYRGSTMSSKQRSRVTSEVREIDSASGSEGARLSCISQWIDGDRLTMYSRLKTPLALGQEATLIYRLDWPGYTTRLTETSVDVYKYTFHRRVELMEIALMLDPALGIQRLAVSTVPSILGAAPVTRDSHGGWLVKFILADSDHRKVEYHLDSK